MLLGPPWWMSVVTTAPLMLQRGTFMYLLTWPFANHVPGGAIHRQSSLVKLGERVLSSWR